MGINAVASDDPTTSNLLNTAGASPSRRTAKRSQTYLKQDRVTQRRGVAPAAYEYDVT
jgi:hypothetical protein